MIMATNSGPEVFRRLWRWTKQQIVQDVPDEDALCEFDCRKKQCSAGDWAKCENRLQSVRLLQVKN
jgi:hypothetical protein